MFRHNNSDLNPQAPRADSQTNYSDSQAQSADEDLNYFDAFLNIGNSFQYPPKTQEEIEEDKTACGNNFLKYVLHVTDNMVSPGSNPSMEIDESDEIAPSQAQDENEPLDYFNAFSGDASHFQYTDITSETRDDRMRKEIDENLARSDNDSIEGKARNQPTPDDGLYHEKREGELVALHKRSESRISVALPSFAEFLADLSSIQSLKAGRALITRAATNPGTSQFGTFSQPNANANRFEETPSNIKRFF